MKAPTPPTPNNHRTARAALTELLEYSNALAKFSNRYNKHCDFLYAGINISFVASLVSLLVPGYSLALASFTMTVTAGTLFFILNYRRNRYLDKALYVLKIIDDIMGMDIIGRQKDAREAAKKK